MQSSNILHQSSSSHDSTFNRKRFLDDDDLLDSNKKSRTAPPSPPLMSSFRSKSLSPSPPSSSFSLPTPITPHATIHSANAAKTKLPSISHITSKLDSKKDLKYLSQNTRYGNTNHALDYPDTCVNDDDWRLNLEVWIEKNFPEKFSNLKNVLRFDKPGLDLLNDAIILTELKEKLDQQICRKPSFNSKISKKMMSPNSRKNYIFQKKPAEVISDEESYGVLNQWNHSLSPISQHASINRQEPTSPQYNYTYQTTQPSSPIQQYASPTKTKVSSPTWNGYQENPVLLKTETFIHTQNHKGLNHTYTIHHHNMSKRKCISCGSDQSPCWRPSWSTTAGQLCNSCGLRYKKTGARCTIDSCRRIPAKGEWAAMKQRGKIEVLAADGSKTVGYGCLSCGGDVEVKEKAN